MHKIAPTTDKYIYQPVMHFAQAAPTQIRAVVHRKWKLMIMNKIKNFHISFLSEQGLIAFTSLLVISAVALGISVSIVLLGIGEANSSLGFKKGQETLRIAEACAEEALLRLRDSAVYPGSTLNVGDGSCTMSVSGSGSLRTIDVGATITGPPRFVKNIRVNVQRLGQSISITSWSEVL